MAITRLDTSARYSQAVIHDRTIYLAGQVGAPGAPVGDQARAVLNQIDELLARAGSDKSHILSATIWLADMADYDEMNAVWDAWVAGIQPPTRATGESRLASPDYKIEIIVVAAQK